MAPPVTNEEVKTGIFASYKKPISEWTHLRSFDTAEQCEKWLDGLRAEAKKNQDPKADLLRAMIPVARCIPSHSIQFK